jgi:sulfatase maturation enzyme AslB (radical SAM superfamily)
MEKENLLNLTVLVTSKCSLKCKLCATYAPYNLNPRNYAYENLTRGVDCFFNTISNQIDKFTISGGEPLLYPQLHELIDFFSKYIDRINLFEIITNGTIIPSRQILRSLAFSDKVSIMIDNYGPQLSKRVPQVSNAFSSMGIQYRLRKYYGADAHCGGWIDIADFSIKNRSQHETETLFNRCMYTTTFKNHYFLIDDKVYMCYVNHTLLDAISDAPGEYVNLLDDSVDVAMKKHQLLNLRNRKSLSVCALCNGFCEDAKRYMPAEQL